MRLHRLSGRAFGPFPGEVEVDFDALGAGGLFLLTGPTGAGKTSILDMICFALYGAVPGDRGAAKRLRCDQAAPLTSPVVQLEVTLAGRRLRFVRSPSWHRPKRRGNGTTVAPATVTVTELVGGAWAPVTTRHDEAGHLVTALIGMNQSQFTQVAMLPQGRFWAFLRARSDDRHTLLQQLFRTGRFEQVERWLNDHRRELAASSAEHHDRVADVLSRICEVADTALPEDWEAHRIAVVAESGELAGWAEATLADLRNQATTATAAADTAAEQMAHWRGLRDQAVKLDQQQRAFAAAAQRLRSLEADAAKLEAARDELDQAIRAEALSPLAELVGSADTTLAEVSAEVADRRTRLAAELDLDQVTSQVALSAAGTAAADAARLRAALPARLRLVAARQAITDARSTRSEHTVALDRLHRQHRSITEELTDARQALTEAVADAEAATGLAVRLDGLRTRLGAAARAQQCAAELTEAETALTAATGAVHRHKEHWLNLREARLQGMAAEMAALLTVGGSCPVCGSADHPHPAEPTREAPDAAAERAARALVDDAEVELTARRDRVVSISAELAAATARADGEQAALAAEQHRVQAEYTRLRRADPEAARRTVAGLDRSLAETTAHSDQHRVAIAALEAVIAERTREVADLAAELGPELSAEATDLTALIDRAERLRTLAQETERGLVEVERCSRSAHEAEESYRRAALAAGFTTVTAATSAIRTPAQQTHLSEQLTAYEQALGATRSTLADPDLLAADAAPPPDLAAITESLRAAESTALRAAGSAQRAGAAAARIQVLHTELHRALTAWTPVRAEHELACSLASFAAGKSPDNSLQMRLSAYAIAFRLGQVVAAANLRLATMSDHRYALVHVSRRGTGETRGGLSLAVRDDWSGEERDPATLSGGESFVVSLALALGLADVITAEAGGVDLGTLFIDEGFGSLDADTLDDVINTIDSLRAGGRVVGVVSHVAELRDRIPTQLRVRKSRTGSTVVAIGSARD